MRRLLITAAALLAALVPATAASAGGTIVPSGSASCVGFLAAAANPNNGTVLHELVKPALAADGRPLGDLQRELAGQHPGVGGVPGLLACIPEF